MYMIYLLWVQPMKTRSANLLEALNEVVIWLQIYHLFLFTDFVESPETRYYIGWSTVGFTFLQIGVNLGLIIVLNVRELAK